jgi:quercetin dioxygenase-like cupin family protein
MKKVYRNQEAESAKVFQDWGSLSWLASKQVGNAEGLTLGRVVIKKGESNPQHCHPTVEVVLYLLKGKLEHALGDEVFTLEPGDVLTIPAGVLHHAVSVGEEDADMIVVYSSAERDFEKVDVRGLS